MRIIRNQRGIAGTKTKNLAHPLAGTGIEIKIFDPISGGTVPDQSL